VPVPADRDTGGDVAPKGLVTSPCPGHDGCSEERIKGLASMVIGYLASSAKTEAARLRATSLRVNVSTRHPERVNAFSVQTQDGTEIVVGEGLCMFLGHYTRAAATYFLPSTPGGPRPSELWPDARASLATTVEWLSSPSMSPRYPNFEMTPHQARIGEIFATYALRFVLCHEIGHSIADHSPVDITAVGDNPQDARSVLEFSHAQEVEADRLGLRRSFKMTVGVASRGLSRRV
jgi:hypothetical protein